MLGCFGRSKKKYKETKVGKGPGKIEEPAKIKKPQQVIDKDTRSCIVTNGDGPREIPSKERQESEGSGDTYHRHVRGKQYHVKANVANFGDHGKTKVIKNDKSSRSSSDSTSRDSFDEMNGAPPIGASASSGNQGQGGNVVNKIEGGTGNTFNFSYTGKYVQLGQNSSINKYYQHKKEKKNKAEIRKEREQECLTPPFKEPAITPTSSSCPDSTTEVKVEKLQKSPNETSTADDQPIPVRRLGHSSGPSAGNMRAPFDETESVYNQRLLVDLAKSIGIVKSPYGPCGTGFRVGSKYIMTAKHVKDEILNAAPAQLSGLNQPPRINHLNDAFIDFSHEVQGIPSDDNLKFYFEPKIVYENDNMDTVILQLKPNMHTEYPPPLTCFAELSEPNGQLYLIGHSRADIKKTDKFCCVQLTKEEKASAEQWSVRQVGVNGFIGIDNPQRVLLHCSFQPGASGSPGVWVCRNDHHAYIVTMLLSGYPGWYYNKDYPSEKKHGIPHHHLVEQGACMRSLYEDIKVTKPDLWQEIFCFNSPMSQDGDDVEMKSV